MGFMNCIVLDVYGRKDPLGVVHRANCEGWLDVSRNLMFADFHKICLGNLSFMWRNKGGARQATDDNIWRLRFAW
jgi:hypothetical protein